MSAKLGIVRECQHPGKPHAHGRDCYVLDRCRCPLGRAWAAEDAQQRYRARILGTFRPARVNAIGTARRTGALMHLGYDHALTSSRAGVNDKTLELILAGKQARVYRSYAEAISSLYVILCTQERPAGTKGERIAASMAKGRAMRRGYLPPDCWEDVNIDDPTAAPNLAVLAGNAAGYPYDIRTALAVQLIREFPDMTQREIAARASVGDKTVRRLERSAA